MLAYAVLFTSAAILSYLLAYPVRWLAVHFEAVDRPDQRKMHQIPIPLLGGLGVFLSFAIVSAVSLATSDSLPEGSLRVVPGLAAGCAIILLLGMYDDIRGLKPRVKFAVQILAALVVVAMGGRVADFTNPLGTSFHLGWLGIPITVLWIVGVTNAVNLIDGLDGLAAGIGSIASLGLFAVSASSNLLVASLTLTLAGALIGFLRHNFYPAKLFLGDTGSMFIGFTLAVVGLHGSLKATTATVLFLPIIVLGVPIFDTLFAIFRRARQRVSPFKADREHIHHRLVRIGLHHRNVVLVMYFICIYLALTAYSIAQFPYQTAFLFLVLLTMGGIIGLRTLQFIEERLEAGVLVQPAPEPGTSGRGGGYGKPRIKNGSARGISEFSTLLCEVGGFREGYGQRPDMEALCADLNSMLSRRVKVHAVVAEPSAPGFIVLIIRTEPLEGNMAALVRDGLTWFLDDQRTRFAVDPAFPLFKWIKPGPDPQRSGGPVQPPDVASRSAAPAAGERREEGSARPLSGDRARAFGS